MEIRELSDNIIRKSNQFSEVMSACATLLKHSDEAKETREYLSTRLPKPVPGFSLGFFPPNQHLHTLLELVDKQTLLDTNLLYERFSNEAGQQEMMNCGILYQHNLVMSYKNLYGDIVGMVGRSLLEKEDRSKYRIPKYKNTDLYKSLHLFGLYNAKEHILSNDSVIIVEGQFDCITCHRYGFRNVIALGGASFSKYHLAIIKRYTNKIKLLMDNDVAGEKAASKITYRYGSDANISTISLPTCYKDIDTYLNDNSDHGLLIM